MRHVLSAVVQNVPGVLSHISGMLASRGYNIDSLAVDPEFFRQGLASQLLRFVMQSAAGKSVMVDTAIRNKPAISLYRKLGFLETKNWKTPEGIKMVTLSVNI